jgi:hypothetical protein
MKECLQSQHSGAASDFAVRVYFVICISPFVIDK